MEAFIMGIFLILFLILFLAIPIISGFKELNSNSTRSYSIKKVIIVSGDSRKKASSVATRGIVGGAVLGPVGLIAGAASGKNKQTTTFLIEYSDGRKETKTVDNNSSEFQRLCKYLDM